LTTCADEQPSSDTQASSADDTATDEQDETDDDDDDAMSRSRTDYQHDANDNSQAFDYVRVQLPMGGHGDNIAKSQLTANQVQNLLLSLTQLISS